MNRVRASAYKLTNFVETSLVAAQSPTEMAALRSRATEWGGFVKGPIRSLLMDVTEDCPRLTATLIGRQMPPDMSYAGAGGNSIAYRTSSGVVKVLKASLAMNEVERAALAKKEQGRHDVLRAYLGSTLLPQQIMTTVHPINSRQRAVTITQPFCQFSNLDELFLTSGPRINAEKLATILREKPDLDEVFYNFADQGLTMADAYGLAPDTAGRSNLGLDAAKKLVMVDGQPIDFSNPITADRILPQLEDMRSYLDAPHY